eukprot:Skav202537  [mRNA]  locus=scaffold2011:218260:218734:- [translate_table: standard]
MVQDLPPLRQELLDLEKREEKTSDHLGQVDESLRSSLARLEEELSKLDAGAKEAARLEAMGVSYQVQDVRRFLAQVSRQSTHTHASCLSFPGSIVHWSLESYVLSPPARDMA